MQTLVSPTFLMLLLMSLLFGACTDDGGSSTKSGIDCSVSDRCTGQPKLDIRLRQVETYYFENEETTSTSFSDLARFDYNENNQWIGGDTARVAASNIEYTIEYDSEGKMSRSTKVFVDDSDNEATVVLDYFYIGSQLDRSESITTINDKDGNLQKTISETISYRFFADGRVEEILFGVTDSLLVISSFSYEFIYNAGGNLSDIILLDSSVSLLGYVFQSFSYTGDIISSSTTFRLNSSGESIESETSVYDYYPDGPIRSKTSVTNTIPKQRVETLYQWEAGSCASNQTFGDRLFPTPELASFPCF